MRVSIILVTLHQLTSLIVKKCCYRQESRTRAISALQAVLHCLLNQEDFCSLLNDVKVQHLQQGCSQYQQGLYNIIDKVTDKHCFFVELPGGSPPCIISTICRMKQNYVYQSMTKVLPSVCLSVYATLKLTRCTTCYSCRYPRESCHRRRERRRRRRKTSVASAANLLPKG